MKVGSLAEMKEFKTASRFIRCLKRYCLERLDCRRGRAAVVQEFLDTEVVLSNTNLLISYLVRIVDYYF